MATELDKELTKLINEGDNLWFSLLDSDDKKKLKEKLKIEKLPVFSLEYEVWYTKTLRYVTLFIPERLSDFISLYKLDKRKEVNASTYTIADAIQGFSLSQYNKTIAEPKSVIPKIKMQVSILRSIESLMSSVIYKTKNELEYNIFIAELDSAKELCKKGFLRAAGAICGVVIEKHLATVMSNHKCSISKKEPTISDYNDVLKNENIIAIDQWRNIQYLGDLRNLCCHNKTIEPTKEQVLSLLDGTQKIISSIS